MQDELGQNPKRNLKDHQFLLVIIQVTSRGLNQNWGPFCQVLYKHILTDIPSPEILLFSLRQDSTTGCG